LLFNVNIKLHFFSLNQLTYIIFFIKRNNLKFVFEVVFFLATIAQYNVS
jgi:hypothetical protein